MDEKISITNEMGRLVDISKAIEIPAKGWIYLFFSSSSKRFDMGEYLMR